MCAQTHNHTPTHTDVAAGLLAGLSRRRTQVLPAGAGTVARLFKHARYTYIHTYIHTYLLTYLLTYIHTYVHIHTCIHTYTFFPFIFSSLWGPTKLRTTDAPDMRHGSRPCNLPLDFQAFPCTFCLRCRAWCTHHHCAREFEGATGFRCQVANGPAGRTRPQAPAAPQHGPAATRR